MHGVSRKNLQQSREQGYLGVSILGKCRCSYVRIVWEWVNTFPYYGCKLHFNKNGTKFMITSFFSKVPMLSVHFFHHCTCVFRPSEEKYFGLSCEPCMQPCAQFLDLGEQMTLTGQNRWCLKGQDWATTSNKSFWQVWIVWGATCRQTWSCYNTIPFNSFPWHILRIACFSLSISVWL